LQFKDLEEVPQHLSLWNSAALDHGLSCSAQLKGGEEEDSSSWMIILNLLVSD
jgi:hypothetical protein